MMMTQNRAGEGDQPGKERVPLGLPQQAWQFAALRHQGQLYSDTELPYLVHLGAVLLNLLPALEEMPLVDSALAQCCAILHDTVEDTKTTADEIREHFGKQVADGVLALTKDKTLEKRQSMCDSLRRILMQPKEVWMVKLADRTANLGEPPAYWTREKCLAYAEEGQLILDTLGEASDLLSRRLSGRITAWETKYGEEDR
ncbi:MAG: HD domain-containing protein [Azoarcus sp.]|jgi:(p)ppGpp synthase/HD superfamily hydrolase|nr:HD domain-containing protein [Azoarcus sp.]